MNRPLQSIVRRLLVGLLAMAACWRAAQAQDFLIEPEPIHSHSGQFIVHAQRQVARPSWMVSNLATNRAMLAMEPPLLAVSCERIKQSLYRELGLGPGWVSRVYVEVRRTALNEQNVTITSQRFKNGWQYQLELPDPVDRVRYVRAVVQVLLLEVANRESPDRIAEVPLWLVEGLTQQMLASKEIEIILAPPRVAVNGVNADKQWSLAARENPLDEARGRMGGRSPMTFEELSWPAPDATLGGPKDLFSASAQLFVAELLRLKDGRAGLRSMLTQLPKFYNWQFAFLNAFHGRFARPLDVEKWWALSVAASTGRDTAKMWPGDETWRRIDEALVLVLETRVGTNVTRQPWTLQGIIREWPLDRQAEALTTKVLELDTIRAHASQDLVMLVQDYIQVLNTYLRSERKTSPIAAIGKAIGLSGIGQLTIDRLDTLDTRRRALHPVPTPLADGTMLRQPSQTP